ncbi:unnamed protein product [Caenorhabditis auriculariae]|uniref:Uncharacterized protein n=1 Tax=Caenorhabditis auriculariae TaxID=2777116 RepID=A0A8S1HZ81_9PELO|nr:unnamed protein product [Caenorhabditis auriculariae]
MCQKTVQNGESVTVKSFDLTPEVNAAESREESPVLARKARCLKIRVILSFFVPAGRCVAAARDKFAKRADFSELRAQRIRLQDTKSTREGHDGCSLKGTDWNIKKGFIGNRKNLPDRQVQQLHDQRLRSTRVSLEHQARHSSIFLRIVRGRKIE